MDEPTIYNTLRAELTKAQEDIKTIQLLLNGNPFMDFDGLIRRVTLIKQTVDKLEEKDAKDKQDQRTWRILLTVSLISTGVIILILLAILVVQGLRT